MQVGRIDEADAQLAAALVEHDGAEAARLRFGQQADELGLGVEILEIDEGNAQLLGERLRNPFFRYEGTFDDNTPELAAAALLLVEGKLELFVGQQPLLDQQIAETNFFRPSHRKLQ